MKPIQGAKMFSYQEYLAGKAKFVEYFSQFTNEALELEIAKEIKGMYSEYLGGAYVPTAIYIDYEKLGRLSTKGDMPEHTTHNVPRAIVRRIYMEEHNKAIIK